MRRAKGRTPRERAAARYVAARAAHGKAARRLKDAQERADAALDTLNEAIVECQRLGARMGTGVRP